jgi:23S rRNA (cytidine1920-2'-O)/16S rRNA (cytidine1409-2'-O)-methyltransferase
LLVERGLAESRAKAQALVMAGKVLVNDEAVTKAGTLIAEEAVITVTKPPPFISRGGIKLDYALDHFHLDVGSKVVVDVGASTGGFTDCLLKRGANRVYAIDVGRGQLDYRLRQDPRVVVMEGINVRYPFTLPEKVDLATIDVSFISVKKIIPSVVEHLNANGYLVVLIKPQFEARREEVGKGGIIKETTIHARVLGRFIVWVVDNNFRLRRILESPIRGGSGNREFFALISMR